MTAKRRPADHDVPRVSVEGTVVAAEDGRPLAGATVTYWFDPEREYDRGSALRSKSVDDPHPMIGVPPVTTDREGRFRFPAIPFWPGAPRKIAAGHPGRFPSSRTVEFSREGEALRVDLRLGPAATLRGTARMADGTPAAGVEVSHFGGFLHRREKPWADRLHPCTRFHPDRLLAVTGPDGRYELGPFPRGVPIAPFVHAPFGVCRRVEPVTVPPDAFEAERDLVLDSAGQVDVELVRGRGPLPRDVHLEVRPAGEPDAPRGGHVLGDLAAWRQRSWTVNLPALRPGPSLLVVRARNARGPGGERRVPLTVRAGRVVRVRVATPPASGRPRWRKDVGGRSFFSPVPEGDDARLGRPWSSLAGVVRDAATGKPIRGARVSDVWRPSHEHLGEPWRPGDSMAELSAPPVRTDARGRFRLEGVPFEAGEERKVLFEAEGFWTTARVFGLARRREVRRFDIRLRRAGVLRGTVRDLRGRLLPGAEVSASVRRPADDDADSLHRDLGTRLWTVGNLSETTGPDGRFVLAPLPFHRWIDVHARGSGLSNLSLALYPDRPEGRMDFVVDPGGALRVLLLAPSGPRKGPVAVELRRPDGDLVFSSGWHPGDSDGPIPTTHEQLHEVIAPGEYRLAVKAEGLRGPARPLTVRIRRGRTSTVRVSLRAQGRPGPS